MFSLLKGFAVGNPWVTVLLLVALIGGGFSAGVWLENLRKNAEISKLVLDAQVVKTQLAEGRATAEEKVRQLEMTLAHDQAALELQFQNELNQKEKAHEINLAAVRQFERQHAAQNYVIPDGAMLVWLPSGEHPSAEPNRVPPVAGSPTAGDAAPTECRLSDLLADHANYKDALGKCAAQVRSCQETLIDWHRIVNGH